ncbi:MAG TPA: hypothetical protein VJ647_00525 [Chitinophagaceae bacterium]|nr:hypothetical protein [Chitinophagaceae bacterium]
MAKLGPDFSITGSLMNISAYKMRGVEGTILRTKGGASKEKIKKDPAFERTRELNAEFGGRAAGSKWIMQSLWPQKALADYNIAGPINTLLKPIQDLDTESKRGQRHIILSKNPRLLEGFSLNKNHPFDSVIRTPVLYSVEKDSLSASISIPALLPGINFYMPRQSPMYSIIAVLGIVPDLFYHPNGYKPSSDSYREGTFVTAETSWYPALQGSEASSLELSLDIVPPDSSFSLLLSIGIRLGTMQDATTIQQVARAGAAKVLGMG